MAYEPNYIKKVFIALDQLLNAICDGNEDVTLSARCWIYRDRRGWRTLWKLTDWVALKVFKSRGHCQKAFIYEVQSRIEWLKKHTGGSDDD